MTNVRKSLLAVAVLGTVFSGAALADDWNMYLTVDNQFDVYYGNSTATNYFAGGGSNWSTTYNFTALGRSPTDFTYVATASDQWVAQGFIGVFTNTTLGATIETNTVIWEVFPAGAFAATNPYSPGAWPASLMPTQTQVDTAINYATTNNLWVAPSTAPGYTNGAAPWGTRPNIPAYANWIWYDSHKDPGGGGIPVPFDGFNHDEFLVFRVAGIAPEPVSAVLLALGGLLVRRKR
jgi:hypothetical protein